MIHIDRHRIAPPEILLSTRVEEAQKRAWDTYYKGKLQKKVIFDEDIWLGPEVTSPLRELFHNKCAFCELPVSGRFLVEHFRPKMHAVNMDGKVDMFHYFWLAYEWDNIFLICNQCSRKRGSRFPVKGQRAPIGAKLEELAEEQVLLLNPCEDRPEEHLVFSSDGMVSSATEKGRVTIELLDLNRPDSLADRKEEYTRLVRELASLEDQSESELLSGFEALKDPQRPFAGMRRQFIDEWFQQRVKQSPQTIEMYSTQQSVQQPVYTKHQKRVIKSEYKIFNQAQESYSLKNDLNIGRYYLRTRWIEKVQIHNFKIIKDLTLYPTAGRRSEGPWLMLLGENGTGKSSILQAITLALIGDQYRATLGIDPDHVLRNRCKSGFVKIHLAGTTEPIELHFSKNSSHFESNLPDPNLLLLGYGATRLLPHGDTQPLPGSEYAHVDNLFNPFVPLKDASRWLYELNEKNSVEFENVARALKNLLTLTDTEDLVCDPKIPGRVNVRAFGQTVSIKKISDGYQTVLALACDIMAILLERWETIEVAEGTVLIDEIGSHLHPRWQMQVIKSLRQVFPRVQFLITTHYPLCLRGLYNRELAILQRTPQNKIIALDRDLPEIEGMRVDQLLTSEYFGLNSTIDPDLDEQFNEYYGLLAISQRTQEQENRLDQLKTLLDRYRVFGNTRRQRMALEAIDEFLAQESKIVSLDQRSDLKEETKHKVADMWAQIRAKK